MAKTKICVQCNQGFDQPANQRGKRWEDQKLCSNRCRHLAMGAPKSNSKTCEQCGLVFQRPPNQRGAIWTARKYCTKECYGASLRVLRTSEMRACEVCAAPFVAKQSGIKLGRARFCSDACRHVAHGQAMGGAGHHAWDGGRVVTRQGYIRVWVADDHPFACLRPKGSNHVLEHRLVMSEMLGRPMKRGEQVHHKNALRDDNRPENLELRTGSHGNGATKHCLTCTCADH